MSRIGWRSIRDSLNWEYSTACIVYWRSIPKEKGLVWITIVCIFFPEMMFCIHGSHFEKNRFTRISIGTPDNRWKGYNIYFGAVLSATPPKMLHPFCIRLLFLFFGIMSFNIFDDCKYFITAHPLLPEYADQINNLFSCHSIAPLIVRSQWLLPIV